jgi:hypothetical protein
MMANNLAYLHQRFADPPSPLYEVRVAINQADVFTDELQALIRQTSGEYIAKRTIDNLMSGRLVRPLMRTVTLIMRALGWRLSWKRVY